MHADTNTDTIATINALHIEACHELLESYGVSAEHHVEAGGPEAGEPRCTVCSLLSATGQGLKFVSLLQPDRGFLTHMYPGESPWLTPREIEDWCGEINNQLVGRLKNKLIERGCEVMLGLPSLLTGRDICAARPREAAVESSRFETPHGTLRLVYMIQADPELLLHAPGAVPAAEGVMREGELSLF